MKAWEARERSASAFPCRNTSTAAVLAVKGSLRRCAPLTAAGRRQTHPHSRERRKENGANHEQCHESSNKLSAHSCRHRAKIPARSVHERKTNRAQNVHVSRRKFARFVQKTRQLRARIRHRVDTRAAADRTQEERMLSHAHESQRQATHSVYMPVNLL